MGSGPTGGILTPGPLTILSDHTTPMTTATRLTASEARCAIYDLADLYSWETVAREMICNMSGDQAREFVEDFQRLYAD